MKVSPIGMGRVGSTLGYTLLLRGLDEESVLVGAKREIAEGEGLALVHAETFTGHPVTVRAGELADTAGSDVLAISCSAPWSPSYASRFDIGRDNLKLFRQLIPPLAEASPDAKLLVITNPVDVMTYHAIELSGFPPGRVFGTGTLVGSARFRSLLSARVGIPPTTCGRTSWASTATASSRSSAWPWRAGRESSRTWPPTRSSAGPAARASTSSSARGTERWISKICAPPATLRGQQRDGVVCRVT